ncbi:uncharacterized protein MAM_07563 [Metarhizium album ARSEF 1941]|uniref:Uncharacterized protein n=1 Tax=Metarhizium album (strain ARSEF 1941) TaxID=1081103 RepID=A0A0B2WKP1_METAS|nr:uncharacterized protein MAM_07563 [Metarhizium album ARSEF 1941]KHN94508.1 hypothetical protein MAM_07563 [Metarhizium album ARSEF 1941]
MACLDYTVVGDGHISLRLKHGIHTIYLFADAQASMSDITKELLELLSERYPNGLTTATAPPKTTPIPPSPKVVYGLLNVPNDPSRGWRRVKTGEDESSTPTTCGLENNSIVSFTFVSDLEDEDVVFEVEWPKDDDELYDQAV